MSETVAIKQSYTDRVICQLPKHIVDEIRGIYEDCTFDFLGLRIEPRDAALAVGDIAPASYYSPDGMQTDEQLYGAAAVEVDEYRYDPIAGSVYDIDHGILAALQAVMQYDGSVLLVLGSDLVECGNDIGEIEMKDAEVLAVFEVTREG